MTMTKWIADECEDAEGNVTIRVDDGTANGDTDQEPIATVYAEDAVAMIANAPMMLAALKECLCRAPMTEQLEHQVRNAIAGADEAWEATH